MVFIVSLLAVALLVWLSLPPRDDARWALFAAMGVAALWLVSIGWWYGIPAQDRAMRWLWLVVLSLVGAPLVHLFVWSAVRLVWRRVRKP
nr:hypothetical protein [Ardenticatena sp.]